MKKKLIALILCICLISCTCIQPAYAMGAEGIIVGGGAAAAGVTLTMPQVALLVAAGFGLVYATQHAEEIYNGLDTALTNAANNIEGGMEQLAMWNEQAAKGQIAIASAPTWIVDSIKSWISGLYNSRDGGNIGYEYYLAYEDVPGANFWYESPTEFAFSKDVFVVRAGNISEFISNGEDWVDLGSYFVAFSTENIRGEGSITINGVTYYYTTHKTVFSCKADTLNEAGFNKSSYEAISTLPPYQPIKETYNTSMLHYNLISAWLDGLYIGNDSVCPDATVGGIEGALDVGGIDNIKVPDLDIGGSKLLVPPNVGTGAIDDVLNDILTRLKQQELSWSDYMSDVAVGNPSITIEGKDYVIDDTGVTDIPVEDVVPDNPPADGVVVPEGLEPFTMSLTDFFPFCIPFDIADFVNVLCAEPEAPCFDWTFTWYGGNTDTLTIDLSPFNQVAQLLRNMELLLFCIGLALITRNQIRG